VETGSKLFNDVNPKIPFPENVVKRVGMEISKAAKDMDKEWKGPKELVDFVFSELNINIPSLDQKNRWEQYLEFIREAVTALHKARGFDGIWSLTK